LVAAHQQQTGGAVQAPMAVATVAVHPSITITKCHG